jgi:hypothetical protein
MAAEGGVVAVGHRPGERTLGGEDLGPPVLGRVALAGCGLSAHQQRAGQRRPQACPCSYSHRALLLQSIADS